MKQNKLFKLWLLAVILLLGSGSMWGQVEQIIYSTGFESNEGFTSGSTYNNTTIKYDGATSQQWGTYYGTASTTGPITGSMSMQMRYYTGNPLNLGYTFTNFNLSKVTKVTFNALNTSGNNISVSYSTDGGTTYTGAQTFTLGTTSAPFTYNVSSTGEFSSVRIKFQLIPGSTDKSRITIDDLVVYGMVGTTPTVVTPTFSPATGTYYTSQNVTLSTTTPSASIYYTTDGTDPNNAGNGTLYSAPIAVSATTTIKARAYATGFDPSAVASATYTILAPQTTTLPYTENFATGAGKTYVHSKSGDAKVWTYNAGGFMNINGYGGAAVEEDWLVLPGINLNNYTGTKTLSLDTWWQYGTNDTDNYLKLMYSTDYAGVGDPSTATWTELTYTQPTAANTWTSSGNIDLSSISGTSVYLAFKYRGTTGNYRSWSVDNISIQNPKYAVTFNVDMNGTSGYTDVYVAGTFNSWNATASKMTTSGGNIFTFTSDAVFNSGDVIEFKIVKDGSTWESIANRTYTTVAGTNTVNVYWNATTLPQLDWVNLQYPASAMITSAGTLDVYAKVYEAGLTETDGQGADISAWIGYSTSDTNPNTWTNWVAATFNTQKDNNDEYKATIGSALAGGKYYYASRFKYGLNDYVYGGLNGFWDASSSKSGVLTVIATEPAAHVTNPAATANSSTEITVTWADATANGYLVKGSTVSYDDIAAPVDGVAETNGTLVRNVTSGTQTYKFTSLTPETPYYFKIFPYNGSGEQINYKVDATVPQATATTFKAPTVLQAGDIAILQVNSSTTDRIAFVTFVELNPGTVINFTDNGFTSATTVRTGEGLLTYTAPTTILAGTAISWYNGMTITGTGWSSNNPSNFALGGGDQLFAYQGTWGTDQTLIYGVSLSKWIIEGTGSSSTSYLPSALTDNVKAFCFATSKDNAYYTNITSGTANALKSLITYNTNWTTSTSNQGAQTWTFNLGTSTTLDANTSVYNLTIATDETLTINPGKQLTVTGTAVNNGTLTLESTTTDGSATLVTSSEITGTMKSTLAANRWWYVASPVNEATTTLGLNYYDASASPSAYNATATTMTSGVGYAVKPTAETTITFTGTLKAGDVSVPIHYNGNTSDAFRGYNLIGNPYPSALNWNNVYADATNKTNIASTMWYRSNGAYQTYNASGSVGVPSGVEGYIPPMQAFWVRSAVAPTTATASNVNLLLNNTMRSHSTLGANPLRAPQRAAAAESNQILRLQVAGVNNTDETVLYFNSNAAMGFDTYDSPKLSGTGAEIYTLLNTQPIVINGMNEIPYNTEIALGFKPVAAGTFTISAGEFSNFAATDKVILKDKLLNTETDLTLGSYTFTSDAVSTTSRFSVMFPKSGVPTGVDNEGMNGVNVYAKANRIVVATGEASQGSMIYVFNSVGERLAAQTVNGTVNEIGRTFPAGVYVVKVNNHTAKVIIR